MPDPATPRKKPKRLFWILGGLGVLVILPVLVLAAIFSLAGLARIADEKLGPPRESPAPDRLMSRAQSDRPEDRGIAEMIAGGVDALHKEWDLAEKRGDAIEMPSGKAEPRPNAARDYEALTAALTAKPLEEEVNSALKEGMAPLTTPSPLAMERYRALFAARPELLRHVHGAAATEGCLFSRDWTLGTETQWPELSKVRDAARLLRAESLLMSRAGRHLEAVRNQALGFRLARHGASDPSTVSYLVGTLCHFYALQGLQQILHDSQGKPEVCAAVRHALATAGPPPNLRRALSYEPQLIGFLLRDYAMEGPVKAPFLNDPERYLQAAALSEAEDAEKKLLAADEDGYELPKREELEQDELFAWEGYLDASNAHVWSRAREMLSRSGSSYRAKVEGLAAALAEDRARWRQEPQRIVAGLLLPIQLETYKREALVTARTRVTEAACRLLEYRARHGEFPAALSNAMERVPSDPFTEKPLLYRREGKGFVIYSAGSDGKFDGNASEKVVAERNAYFRYPQPTH